MGIPVNISELSGLSWRECRLVVDGVVVRVGLAMRLSASLHEVAS